MNKLISISILILLAGLACASTNSERIAIEEKIQKTELELRLMELNRDKDKLESQEELETVALANKDDTTTIKVVELISFGENQTAQIEINGSTRKYDRGDLLSSNLELKSIGSQSIEVLNRTDNKVTKYFV